MKASFFLSLLAVILFSSCRVAYVPTMQNAALLEEQFESEITLNPNNAQTAFAITKNIGIMANGHYRETRHSLTSGLFYDDYRRLQQFYEAGVGYSTKLGDNFATSVFAGSGSGLLKFSYYDANRNDRSYFQARNIRYFIQPNIGYTHEIVDVIFSMRVLALDFYGVTNYGYETDGFFYTLPDKDHLANTPYVFMEPGITVRVGFKYVKFHSQFMSSLKAISSSDLDYIPFNANFGVTIELAPRMWKKD